MTTKEHINTYPNIPFFSLILAAGAFLLQLSPDCITLLQFDREMIAGGEWWRLITCQWVHWSFDHFLWCALTLIALGASANNFL